MQLAFEGVCQHSYFLVLIYSLLRRHSLAQFSLVVEIQFHSVFLMNKRKKSVFLQRIIFPSDNLNAPKIISLGYSPWFDQTEVKSPLSPYLDSLS